MAKTPKTSENTTKLTLKKGDKFFLNELVLKQNFTKPPSRYSPATLIKKMEDLGIGRPSTYASIISTILEREYVEPINTTLRPTNLGTKVSDILTENFSQVTSSELTAELEDNLDKISRGEKGYVEVLKDFWFSFKEQVEGKKSLLKDTKDKYKSSPSDVPCPTCSSSMELKIGRFGEYYQCLEHREHQFQKNFKEYEKVLTKAREEFNSQLQNKKCDFCSKDLIVRVSKSSLNPYIACPAYQVGNKHTVSQVNFGPCPKCQEEGRQENSGVLVKKKGPRGNFIGCTLDKKVCGFIQKNKPVAEKVEEAV